MPPTTLGRSASGGHDDDPFVKGYQAGFQHGWAQGFERGKEEGRGEAAPQIESRAGDDAAEGGEEARGSNPRQYDYGVCLLSDALLPEASGDSSSIREEDVFHDARSVISASGSEESDLIDIFYDAESQIAAAASDHGEKKKATQADSTTPRTTAPNTNLPSSSQDQVNLSPNTGNDIPAPSPGAINPDNNVVSLVVAPAQPTSLSPSVPKSSTAEKTTVAPAPTPGAAHNSNNGDTAQSLMDDAYIARVVETINSIQITAWPWNPRPHPQTTTAGTLPTIITGDTPSGTTLYNIPLPHTTTPLVPDMFTPPSELRTRPPYPTLNGTQHNIYALLAQGRIVVDSPWRVLIGPLSDSARSDWGCDAGKKYLRSKLVRAPVITAPVPTNDYSRGGYGGFGGFGGRGNNSYRGRGGRGGRGGGGHGRDGGGRGQGDWQMEQAQQVETSSGLIFAELLRAEGEEVWYVLATFDAQAKARDAVDTFAGYACGGSIMWAWIYQEEE